MRLIYTIPVCPACGDGCYAQEMEAAGYVYHTSVPKIRFLHDVRRP